MDFGLTSKLGEYYLAQQYQKNGATGKSSGVSFAEIAAVKTAKSTTGMSFEEMLKAKYPEAKYHVMDAHTIPQGVWNRADFPFEKFFEDNVDESILNLKPNGAEPALTDPQVQSRVNATLGKKSIVIPPELEEKMKNDPELAASVMQKIESHIADSDARLPGKRKSFVIVFDENGEIANFTTVTEGRVVGPTEREIRQFEAEQAAKKKRREEYARLNEESALKRKLMEQEADARYYKTSIVKEAITAAYEANALVEPTGSGNIYMQ